MNASGIERPLPDSGHPPTFQYLADALQFGTEPERAEAARGLRDRGSDAVEPLCAVLTDEKLAVRIAAAESLGELGDPRAVGPLCAALRVRSAAPVLELKSHTLVEGCGYSLGVLLALGLAIAPGAPVALRAFALVVGAWLVWRGVLVQRGRRTPQGPDYEAFCCVATEALRRIAERQPAPELREAAVELQFLAGDFSQGKATRALARETAERIEALTVEVRDLPLAAGAPAPDPATLPLPSEEVARQDAKAQRGG